MTEGIYSSGTEKYFKLPPRKNVLILIYNKPRRMKECIYMDFGRCIMEESDNKVCDGKMGGVNA